jgi:hypothetical protein
MISELKKKKQMSTKMTFTFTGGGKGKGKGKGMESAKWLHPAAAEAPIRATVLTGIGYRSN